jgi:hypothetical protein
MDSDCRICQSYTKESCIFERRECMRFVRIPIKELNPPISDLETTDDRPTIGRSSSANASSPSKKAVFSRRPVSGQ